MLVLNTVLFFKVSIFYMREYFNVNMRVQKKIKFLIS
jgi:hypothetical protein